MGQISKDAYITNKLGANKFPVQQTTRQVFDTFLSGGNTFPETATFFKNFAGKGPGATNLTQGRLDSSESMIIKTINLSLFTDAPSNPVSSGSATNAMNLNVYVGNNRVLKNYPLHIHCVRSGNNFTPYRFQSGISAPNGPGSQSIVYVMRCLTDIVIPGDVNFYATLESANGFNTAVDFQVGARLTFAGYGQLFNAGSSF